MKGDRDPSHVHQLERSEGRAEELASHLLDRSKARDPLVGEAGRLVQVRDEEPVDAEPGGVAGRDRDLAEQVDQPLERGERRRFGARPADDLDQLVDRRRVKEVEAREATGAGELSSEGLHGERGGVRHDEGLGGDEAGDLREERPLHRLVLEDRLDDQNRAVERGREVGAERDAPEDLVPTDGRHLLPRDRPLEHLLEDPPAPGQRRGVDVANADGEPGLGARLGDPAPHIAAAEHGDRTGGTKRTDDHRLPACSGAERPRSPTRGPDT